MLRVAFFLFFVTFVECVPRKMFIYSNSNTRGPNFVEANAFFYDDTLQNVGRWSTGGLGDGLGQFGVSRVATVSCLDYLYASNDASQSISVFRIDRQQGFLSLLPSLATVPVPRNEARYDDVTLTVSHGGKYLFVGMGSSFIRNRLFAYAIQNDGSLTLVSSLMGPIISLPLRLSQLSVSPDSTLLAVSYTSVAGYVALYGIGPDGALAELDLLPDMAPFGRAQGLTWSMNGEEIYAALVNNRPASVGGLGIRVSQNSTMGITWTLSSSASDDSNLIAVDPSRPGRLFFSTQMPAIVIVDKPSLFPTVSVSVSSSTFSPNLINIESGTTVQFTATDPGLSVVQVSSSVSCLPKAQGFDSGPLAVNETFSHTFDTAGNYFVAVGSRCLLGVRMLVVVDPAMVWQDPSATVFPLAARATTLEPTFDGEHLVSSLQTGGFSIQRIEQNDTLTTVATATFDAMGLQGTSALYNMPACCRNDETGPILDYESVVVVPCDYKVIQPLVKLVAACDWLQDQLVTQGVQLPTCNAECDALFRVSLTDLCGQTTNATQYIRHEPDQEPPVVTGGAMQSQQCVFNTSVAGDPSKLVLFDQCQPTDSLLITQDPLSYEYRSPMQCRLDKIVARVTLNWTVTDPCSNSVTLPGSVDSIDTLPPVVRIEDYVVPCEFEDECGTADSNGGTNPDWSGYATAEDLCWGRLSTGYVDVFPENYTQGCDSFTRVWRAMDACGNVGTANQSISYERAMEPQFVVPPDVTVECSADLGFDKTGYPVMQAPRCTDFEKRVETFRVPGGRCTRYAYRKFFASKTTCGEWFAEGAQNITEIDTTGPQILLDPLVHITCEDGSDVRPSNPSVGYPVVIDACQGVIPNANLTYTDTVKHLVQRPPHCLDEITRTWFASDGCGNESNATQTIYATRHCGPCGDGPCHTKNLSTQR